MEAHAESEVVFQSSQPVVIIIQISTGVNLHKGITLLLSVPEPPEGSQIRLFLSSVLS